TRGGTCALPGAPTRLPAGRGLPAMRCADPVQRVRRADDAARTRPAAPLRLVRIARRAELPELRRQPAAGRGDWRAADGRGARAGIPRLPRADIQRVSGS